MSANAGAANTAGTMKSAIAATGITTASANNLDQAKHKFIEMLGSAEKCVKNKERTIPSTFDKFANYFFEKFYKRKVGESTFRVAMSN